MHIIIHSFIFQGDESDFLFTFSLLFGEFFSAMIGKIRLCINIMF